MSLKFLDVINYEGGNDVLVWKHPCEDFNTGSHLIVHESQEALFMCNGQVAEIFGPGRHDLKTENIPVLRRLLNIPTGGVSPFHCEVYYINKSIPMDLKWGTPDQVIAMDPQFHKNEFRKELRGRIHGVVGRSFYSIISFSQVQGRIIRFRFRAVGWEYDQDGSIDLPEGMTIQGDIRPMMDGFTYKTGLFFGKKTYSYANDPDKDKGPTFDE